VLEVEAVETSGDQVLALAVLVAEVVQALMVSKLQLELGQPIQVLVAETVLEP
jgi:hypothetical protein